VAGRAVVVRTANRTGGVKLTVLTAKRALLNLSARDFAEEPRVLADLELPQPFDPTRPEFQRRVAEDLTHARLSTSEWSSPEVDRQAVHPVEDDPDLSARLKAATQADRVAREVDQLREQVRGRGSSVARRFDRVLSVLGDWGYVDGWSLTEKGRMLAGTFHECDLLVSECIDQGLLDGLPPAELAGLVSVLVYEHRSSEPPPAPWFPSAEVRKRLRRIETISSELRGVEERQELTPHRAPDPTYIAVAYAWAVGEGFAEVVEAEELSGGDFVRNMKQLIDLLRQIAIIAPKAETRRDAERAGEMLLRGVVAVSSAIGEVE
ncbi:MAG: hypothetical protein ACKOJC_06050, partial [Actinomycetota bacterium]